MRAQRTVRRAKQGVMVVLMVAGLGMTNEVATRAETAADRMSGATLARVKIWNFVANTAVAIDHTPVRQGETRVFGEQVGPARSAKALAVVHIALFEAMNAVAGGYRTYLGLARVPDASIDAALAQAAHDALAGAYKSQAHFFAPILVLDLALIPPGPAKAKGIALGKRAAAAILARRADDGSHHDEPQVGIDYVPPFGPGFWEQDPVSEHPLAMGAFWGGVKPFVIASASQFRLPPPPALASAAYAASFDEVKRLGGCGTDPDRCLNGFVTPTERTADQTIAGIYWGYDGTPGLGTPPRLYNQIAVKIASERGTNAIQLARLLALINVGMADAALACWESKYVYVHWRPITAIRRAGEDGNDATVADQLFTPLGAPATNTRGGPNFTPPFPAYASGHSTFGSVLFHTLRLLYGTDTIAFTFVSDEFNGINRDNQGRIRPRRPRSFSSLSHAEEENGQSRIYLGIHWSYDKEAGRVHGRAIAEHMLANVFQPQ